MITENGHLNAKIILESNVTDGHPSANLVYTNDELLKATQRYAHDSVT